MSEYGATRQRRAWPWARILCTLGLRECPACRWWRETGKP